MMGKYAFYIIGAYGFAFIVLAGLALSTLLAWRRVRREADE